MESGETPVLYRECTVPKGKSEVVQNKITCQLY